MPRARRATRSTTGAAVEAYEAALKLTPTDSGIQAALADAQAAGERKREALMMPAVMEFARRKQAGAAMLAEAGRRRRRRVPRRARRDGSSRPAGRRRALGAAAADAHVGAPRMEEQLVEATKEQERAAAES